MYFIVSAFPLTVSASESWLWPVESCTSVSSGRGYSSGHRGIDIPGAYGAAIRATKSGTIYTVYGGCVNHNARTTGISCTSKGCSPLKNGMTNAKENWDTTDANGRPLTVCNYGTGNGVVISHGDDYYSSYSHMSSTIVSPGQTVKQGDIIGYLGDSGNAAGAHLHFTLLHGSTNINSSASIIRQ